jgi:hypothetical protein
MIGAATKGSSPVIFREAGSNRSRPQEDDSRMAGFWEPAILLLIRVFIYDMRFVG